MNVLKDEVCWRSRLNYNGRSYTQTNEKLHFICLNCRELMRLVAEQ